MTGRGGNGQEGFALLVVIIVLLLVSLLASQLILQVRTEQRTAANSRELAAGHLLAEGGINIALFRLIDKIQLEEQPPEFGTTAFSLGRKYETVLPAGKIEYYATSELGKINLNAGSYTLMTLFLQYQGLTPEEISVVLDSLQDWRDNDDLERLNGAEKKYYEGLTPPYTPRNGNFEDPGEFFLLRGTETLRGRFDPYEVFTVFNSGNRLNINTLPAPIVEFLVEGDPAKVEQYQQLKDLGENITGAQMQQLLGPERYAALNLDAKAISPSTPFYTIVARGWSSRKGAPTPEGGAEGEPAEPGSGAMVRVLVRQDKNGFNYLSWREGYL